MAGSRKNMWCNAVYEAMKDNAIPSHEIPFVLMNRYKNVPSSVQISAVLNRDDRFRKVGLHHCVGISNRKSHQVILFGRADTQYESDPPYNAIKKL